jgi:hypothetical protein
MTTDAAGPIMNRDMSAVADLYRRFLIGLLLALVTRAGTPRAAEVVFRAFRRQQREKFLPGLDKLGLRHLPPAVACAQYHYLSNALGGVKVEWVAESDTKSWVRYLPPRWIFDGTAVCGIPTEVSRAMLLGWHSNNGVALGNLRLGFVCTSQTTDGGPGAIGYYIEEDHDLAPEERLRFEPGETPPGPASDLPTVSWDAERLAKVERNYAMEYVRSFVWAMCSVLGPADAGAIGRIAGRQVGMQYHDSTCARMGIEPDPRDARRSFVELFARLAAASGDQAEACGTDHSSIEQTGWRFGANLNLPPEGFEAWNGLWEGLASVHGAAPGLRMLPVRRVDLGDTTFEWRLLRR